MEYVLYKNIVTNSDVCNGRPTIRGTRMTVQSVLSFVLAGDSDEEVIEAFPRLTKEDLNACKEFVSMMLENSFHIAPIKLSA